MLSGVAFGADGGVALGVGGSGNGMRITLKCRPRHPHRPNVFRDDASSRGSDRAVGRNNQRALRRMTIFTILSACPTIVAPGIRAALISLR